MAEKVITDICQKLEIDSSDMNMKTLDSNIIIVSKFNWNYLEALKFQEECVDLVYHNPKISIIIATNHPACLTVGRGLQKKVGDTTELVDFTDWQRSQVNIPVYDIKRGGGVTFHHPGQLVIYPIVNLTNKKLKVYTLMSNILRELSKTLRELYGEADFDYCRDLLGLWVNESKVASIGLQVRRFVTFHGVALNIYDDVKISESLKIVYPCGLPGGTYKTLSDIYSRKLFTGEINSVYESFSSRVGQLFVSEEECQLI